VTRVKICGVTRLEDALVAAEAGADMIGLNFYRRSPRSLTLEAASALTSALRKRMGAQCPLLIGVFVNESTYEINRAASALALDAVQLSGDESLEVMRALTVASYKAIQPPTAAIAAEDVSYFLQHPVADERLPQILLDAYHPTLRGGTGESVRDEVVALVRGRVSRWMLAGGLTPNNVADRVAQLQPWGVDVASGVEDGVPGVKDHAKMQSFIVRAKEGAQ
jgi:phosphoribosylanthranilate isomerase